MPHEYNDLPIPNPDERGLTTTNITPRVPKYVQTIYSSSRRITSRAGYWGGQFVFH
jgi:hypothetical protein